MSDDQNLSHDIDEIALYESNSCPAELLLPYNLSMGNTRFFPIALLQSKFKQSLWNMDSPLIMAMAAVVGMHLTITILLAFLSMFSIIHGLTAVSFLVLFPVTLLTLTFPMYALLIMSNLVYDENWRGRFLGPTNIGLTESGFKLWWQGSAFYNYPNLAVWSDIFYVDLKDDTRSGDQSLHFIYQSGFGRRTVELPLRGFETEADARHVLNYFARNVLTDNQSEKFRKQASLAFEDCLKKLTLQSEPVNLPFEP